MFANLLGPDSARAEEDGGVTLGQAVSLLLNDQRGPSFEIVSRQSMAWPRPRSFLGSGFVLQSQPRRAPLGRASVHRTQAIEEGWRRVLAALLESTGLTQAAAFCVLDYWLPLEHLLRCFVCQDSKFTLSPVRGDLVSCTSELMGCQSLAHPGCWETVLSSTSSTPKGHRVRKKARVVPEVKNSWAITKPCVRCGASLCGVCDPTLRDWRTREVLGPQNPPNLWCRACHDSEFLAPCGCALDDCTLLTGHCNDWCLCGQSKAVVCLQCDTERHNHDRQPLWSSYDGFVDTDLKSIPMRWRALLTPVKSELCVTCFAQFAEGLAKDYAKVQANQGRLARVLDDYLRGLKGFLHQHHTLPSGLSLLAACDLVLRSPFETTALSVCYDCWYPVLVGGYDLSQALLLALERGVEPRDFAHSLQLLLVRRPFCECAVQAGSSMRALFAAVRRSFDAREDD